MLAPRLDRLPYGSRCLIVGIPANTECDRQLAGLRTISKNASQPFVRFEPLVSVLGESDASQAIQTAGC